MRALHRDVMRLSTSLMSPSKVLDYLVLVSWIGKKSLKRAAIPFSQSLATCLQCPCCDFCFCQSVSRCPRLMSGVMRALCI
jgi:hypothetical protein